MRYTESLSDPLQTSCITCLVDVVANWHLKFYIFSLPLKNWALHKCIRRIKRSLSAFVCPSITAFFTENTWFKAADILHTMVQYSVCKVLVNYFWNLIKRGWLPAIFGFQICTNLVGSRLMMLFFRILFVHFELNFLCDGIIYHYRCANFFYIHKTRHVRHWIIFS